MAFKDDETRKAYFRAYNKGWYQRHRERIIQDRRQRQKDSQDWYRTYKNTLHCVDCGEKHPACLQFHHKNKEEKSFTISYIAGRGVASIGTILKEIEKCEVLCGNCHAKRHWREIHEFDSWEEILGPE